MNSTIYLGPESTAVWSFDISNDKKGSIPPHQSTLISTIFVIALPGYFLFRPGKTFKTVHMLTQNLSKERNTTHIK